MALGDSYATLAELKSYMAGSIDEDVISYDPILTDALSSVSREIELHCHRQFNHADAVSARSYGPEDVFSIVDGSGVIHWLTVDDFCETAGLVVLSGGTTWALSDCRLFPRNGIVGGQTGWPYSEIHSASSLRFDSSSDTSVTAKWGWAAVPAPVKQACLILALETFQIKNAPFGVANMDAFGVIRVRDNRMAVSKLAPYVRDPIRVR